MMYQLRYIPFILVTLMVIVSLLFWAVGCVLYVIAWKNKKMLATSVKTIKYATLVSAIVLLSLLALLLYVLKIYQ